MIQRTQYQSKYPYAVSILLWSFCWLLSCKMNTTEATPVYLQPPTDSVKSILKKAYKARATDLTLSLDLYKKAIETGKQIQDNGGLINAYRSAVFVSSTMLQNVDEALRISDEALQWGIQLNDANTLCDMYGMRAVVYQVSGHTDSATFYNKKALHYFDIDTAPDSLKNWPLYLNIADLYSQLGNQNLAIEFTKKYLNDYVIKTKDTLRLISCYNNLGVYYQKIYDTTAAHQHTYKAWELFQLKPDRQNKFTVYAGMFAMYNNRLHYDSAAYFNEANIKLMEEEDNQLGLLSCVANQMEIVINKNTKIAADEITLMPAFSVALQVFSNPKSDIPLSEKKRFAENLSALYQLKNNQKLAYQYLQQAYTLSNKLSIQLSNKELEHFELERKKVMNQNALLVKQIQIKKKNSTIWALAALSILVISIAISIYIWYNRKNVLQKKKFELLKKEQEWERNTLQLTTQYEERNRISRELHDDLGASLTAIAMEANMLNPQNNKTLESIQLTAQECITALNEIVWTLNNRNDSLFSLLAYIRKYATSFLSKANIELHVNEQLPSEDQNVNSTKRRALYLTVKECLNNIVKHSKATTVNIQLYYANHELNVTIKDNGKGLTLITDNELGNGIRNMKSNIESIGGSINLLNNNGAEIKITIPINTQQ